MPTVPSVCFFRVVFSQLDYPAVALRRRAVLFYTATTPPAAVRWGLLEPLEARPNRGMAGEELKVPTGYPLPFLP